MAAELKQTRAELKQARQEDLTKYARLWRWAAWGIGGILLLVGLVFLFGDLAWLWVLPFGLAIGGFMRAATFNKTSTWYIRFFAWILVFVISAGLFMALFGSPKSELDAHLGVRVVLSCGTVAGWLLVHLLMKKRKTS